MKDLSNYIFKNLDSKRFERKFIMTKAQAVSSELELKKLGYFKTFPDRKVNSIYYDDFNFKCATDNLDGASSRDKIRLRYYEDKLKTFYIETKHKRGLIGYKSSIKFEINKNFVELIKFGSEWCKKNLLDNYMPSAFVSYRRKYFKKRSIRLTIDYDINGYRLINNNIKLLSYKDYSVVEFKYLENFDQIFRKETPVHLFALRNTKCSKYTNALIN